MCILSDNGSNFKSEVMADTMVILSSQQLYTAPYHPEANGVVERLNRTFTSMMRKFVNDQQSDWDIFLPFINRAYNTSVHEVTHAAPHFVVFGSNPESLIDRFLSFEGVPSDRTRWGDSMRAAHDKVLNDLRVAQETKSDSLFDANLASEFFSPYSIGDFVWYSKADLKKKKHDLLKSGPYCVIKVVSQYSYILSDVNTKKEKTAHYSLMSPVDPELAVALSGGEGGANYASTDFNADLDVDPAEPALSSSAKKIFNKRRALLIDQKLKSNSRATQLTTPDLRIKVTPSHDSSSSTMSSRRKVSIVKPTSAKSTSKPEISEPEVVEVRRSRSDRVVRVPARFCALGELEGGEGDNVA